MSVVGGSGALFPLLGAALGAAASLCVPVPVALHPINSHADASLPLPAKKLPKSEPQSTSGAAGRSRGVDLHEQTQQNKSQCCSN